MLVYVDDILRLAHYSKKDMDALNFTYISKEDTFGTPNISLGSNVKKFQIQNGTGFSSIHCVDYLQGDIQNMEDILSKDDGDVLKKYSKGKSPHSNYYRSEVDIANELDAYGIIRYH